MLKYLFCFFNFAFTLITRVWWSSKRKRKEKIETKRYFVIIDHCYKRQWHQEPPIFPNVAPLQRGSCRRKNPDTWGRFYCCHLLICSLSTPQKLLGCADLARTTNHTFRQQPLGSPEMHPVPLRSIAFWGGADTAFRTVSGTHLPEAQPLFYSSLRKPLSVLRPTLAGHVPRGRLRSGRRPRCPRCVSFLLGCHRVFPGTAVPLPVGLLYSPRPLSPRRPVRPLPAPDHLCPPVCRTVCTPALRFRFLLHTSCPCSTISFSRAISSFISLNNILHLCQLWHFMAIQKHLIS